MRANGITLFKVRDETVELLGKSDMYYFSPEHPPLTEPAQRALDWAIDEKLKSGSLRILFFRCLDSDFCGTVVSANNNFEYVLK